MGLSSTKPRGELPFLDLSGCSGHGQHVQRPRGRERLVDPVPLGFMCLGSCGRCGREGGESG